MNDWDGAYARIRDGFDLKVRIFAFATTLFFIYFFCGDVIRSALIDYGFKQNTLQFTNIFLPPMGIFSGYGMHGRAILHDGLTFYIYYAPSSRIALAATALLEYVLALALFAGWVIVFLLFLVIPYQLYRGE